MRALSKFALACAAAAFTLQPAVLQARTKDFAIQGYALPDKPVTIVLMRPDVQVGELQAGGLPEPNVDWTEAARTEIEKALVAELGERDITFSSMEDVIAGLKSEEDVCATDGALVPVADEAEAADTTETGGPVPVEVPAEAAPEPATLAACEMDAPSAEDAEKLVADYRGLHGAVVDAILAHKYNYGGGKLPTQKDAFDYTLGDGTAALGALSGANYGIFMLTIDQFSSDSRKAMQVVGALGCLIGACVIVGGGIHVAYVSLVELETGNVVWFNVLRGSQGDVREEEGARGMVDAILAGMPSRPGEMAATTADEG